MPDSLTPAASSRTTSSVYDSAAPQPPVVAELRSFWEYRKLLRLLVRRNVLVRYKRSLLGVWWTLLNPLLTMVVMWLVFSHLFKRAVGTGSVPYVIYALSGIIVLMFFQQGIEAVSSSVLLNAEVLKKVYVPPAVMCLAEALAAAANLALSTIPLLVFMVALGVHMPWTIILAPLPVLATLAQVLGLGMIVASVSVRFHDALDFSRVMLVLLGYLTPTFYAIRIVPPAYRSVLLLNPLYHDLNLFRNLVYVGSLSSWQPWVAAFGSGLIMLTLGMWVFTRSWRTTAGML